MAVAMLARTAMYAARRADCVCREGQPLDDGVWVALHEQSGRPERRDRPRSRWRRRSAHRRRRRQRRATCHAVRYPAPPRPRRPDVGRRAVPGPRGWSGDCLASTPTRHRPPRPRKAAPSALDLSEARQQDRWACPSGPCRMFIAAGSLTPVPDEWTSRGATRPGSAPCRRSCPARAGHRAVTRGCTAASPPHSAATKRTEPSTVTPPTSVPKASTSASRIRPPPLIVHAGQRQMPISVDTAGLEDQVRV